MKDNDAINSRSEVKVYTRRVIHINAKKILSALRAEEFSAYVVGGAVRDLVMGKEPKDIDIVTSASAEDVRRIAQKNAWTTVEIGAAFGIVNVIAEGACFEIATFVTDHGADPLETLVGDLSHRDFTINAMAMDENGTIIDPFGGQEDVRRGIIRAVGDPISRFREDGLRMFRAARFAAVFGFNVEENTRVAMESCLDMVGGLSVERVRNEIERTITTPNPASGLRILIESGLLRCSCKAKDNKIDQVVPILSELAQLAEVIQNPEYHEYDALEHTLRAVESVRNDLVLRWAALLHDIAKGTPQVRGVNKKGQPCDHNHEVVGAQMTSVIMKRLRVKTEVAKQVVWLIKYHGSIPGMEEKHIIRWLRKLAQGFRNPETFNDAIEKLLCLHRSDQCAGHVGMSIKEEAEKEKMVLETLNKYPFFTSELAITGQDIATVIGEGRGVGSMLKELLMRVQSGHLENDRKVLLQIVYVNI